MNGTVTFLSNYMITYYKYISYNYYYVIGTKVAITIGQRL